MQVRMSLFDVDFCKSGWVGEFIRLWKESCECSTSLLYSSKVDWTRVVPRLPGGAHKFILPTKYKYF